jgi:hypothetical protein
MIGQMLLVVQRRIWGDLLQFQGVLQRCQQKDLTTFVTTLTDELILSGGKFYHALQTRQVAPTRTRAWAKGAIMKLQLISSAVVLYTALASVHLLRGV